MWRKLKTSRAFCLSFLFFSSCLIILYQVLFSSMDKTPGKMLSMTVTRALGALIFINVFNYSEYRAFAKYPFRGSRISAFVFLAALLIALNNSPWMTLLNGKARVTGSVGEVLLLCAECLCIGLFEELAFRGVLLLRLLEKHRTTRKQIVLTTVLSSALFGLIHLVNLLEGASPYSVILQVGYSFLIGGMCAIVLLKTGNLLLCVLVHAVYDFGGNLIPLLGEGTIWNTQIVLWTLVFSLIVITFMLWVLFHISPNEVERFYPSTEK